MYTDINEVEPNDSLHQAQTLTGDTIVVNGSAELEDQGEINIPYDYWGGTVTDDIEDLFSIHLGEPGLWIGLDTFTSDCDLFLMDGSDPNQIIAQSNSAGTEWAEQIDLPSLNAGHYVIGVSIFDPAPIGANTTAYTLTIIGRLDQGQVGPNDLQGYCVYRSQQSDAVVSGSVIATVDHNTQLYFDSISVSNTYYYQVTAMYTSGESLPSNEEMVSYTAVHSHENTDNPVTFNLLQNYPNPFNPSTTIRFMLPRPSFVTLKVYNLLGEELQVLVNEKRQAGDHQVIWEAGHVPCGIYICRLKAGDYTETKKMILQK